MTQLSGSRRSAARLVVLVSLAAALAACGGSAAGPILQQVGGPIKGEAAAPDGDQAGSGGGTTGGDATGGGTRAQQVIDLARADLLVIKTGTLDLQVDRVPDAMTAAASKIAALGGYVSGSDQSGDGENVSASVTYRIPADRWDDALAALRGLATKVLAEKSQTEDVTAQVVDLGARIANLQATELALQAIMAKADKISDVLAVQAELTKVRGDIEQAAAEKKHLEAQAAFSTLTVRFSVQPELAVVASQKKFEPGSEVDRATASLVEIVQGLATAGIWFGIVWLPILVVLGIVAILARLAFRRWRPRDPFDTRGSGPLAPPPAMDAPGTGDA
jgi:hypothetical protein